MDVLRSPFGIFMLAYLAFLFIPILSCPIIPACYIELLHLSDGMISLGNAFFYGTMMLASFRLSFLSTRYGTP